jgi:hypothetical protein
MARGWESKSVEEQMANTLQEPDLELGHSIAVEDAKRLADQQRRERARALQALNLQRENILSQRTSNPARRSALEAALIQIEAQIAQLG